MTLLVLFVSAKYHTAFPAGLKGLLFYVQVIVEVDESLFVCMYVFTKLLFSSFLRLSTGQLSILQHLAGMCGNT